MTDNKNNDHAFVAGIETLGSGGQMLDVLALADGSVLVITDEAVLLYASEAAFEEGVRPVALRRP